MEIYTIYNLHHSIKTKKNYVLHMNFLLSIVQKKKQRFVRNANLYMSICHDDAQAIHEENLFQTPLHVGNCTSLPPKT